MTQVETLARDMRAELRSVEDEVPLVVDLDGTLTRSDLLVEAVFRLLALNPLNLLHMILWLFRGKAAFKAHVADHAVLDLHELPLNEEFVSFLRTERRRGRRVYLASAADRRYVEPLAEHVGLFDGVFASDGSVNLSGSEKARLLCATFGEKGFDYAGNADVDLKVWEKARRAIVVNASNRTRSLARQRCGNVSEIAPRCDGKTLLLGYVKAMRVHQWVKNVLVFLPALASHSLDAATLGISALAFLAFSLCASSVYLLNDLIDLPNDRQHRTKKNRPFASGMVPLHHGLAMIPALLLAAGAIALFLPAAFVLALAAYYATTLVYTFFLKRQIVLDVVALAGLYTVRVVAGAAATGIAISEWLLAFSMFLFLSLALIKRYSELVERTQARKDKPAGRGYRTGDLPMVGALAGASGFVAILVLGLYINSPDVTELYSRPMALWAVGVLLLYWVSRILMLAHRGEVHDDPVVFAIRDRASLTTVALAMVAVAAGTFS